MIEGIDDLIKNGWKITTDGNGITKTFIFTNFIEALGWMVKVGVWAEKLFQACQVPAQVRILACYKRLYED